MIDPTDAKVSSAKISPSCFLLFLAPFLAPVASKMEKKGSDANHIVRVRRKSLLRYILVAVRVSSLS